MPKLFSFFFFLVLTIQSNCQTFPDTLHSFIPSQHKGPLLVGHRGGFDASLPENSISNFDSTFKNVCQSPVAIEFDIRESASGSLFIMHDSTVDRTTNGTGKISSLVDSYLETLSLRDKNGVLTQEKIPLFNDVLRHFQDKNIVLMLDVKGSIYEKVVKLARLLNMESKCILLTFSSKNTLLARNLTDKMMISALVESRNDWESLLRFQVPNRQLITYVSVKTPQEVIMDINASKVLLMTDMSESIRNKSNRYNPDYYKEIILKMHLGILISDYPLFVGKVFCDE